MKQRAATSPAPREQCVRTVPYSGIPHGRWSPDLPIITQAPHWSISATTVCCQCVVTVDRSVLWVCSYSVKNKNSVELTWRDSREKAGENHRAAGWCQVHYLYFCGCWDQSVFKVRGKSFWKFDWTVRPAVKILKTLHINELWRGPPQSFSLSVANT